MSEKVTIERRKAVDLLLELFRLNNHEKMARYDGDSAEDLSRFVLNLRISLSPGLLDWNERLFNWESFFGLKLFPYTFHEGIEEPTDLIAGLEKIKPARLLRRFFGSNLVESDEVEELRISLMERDESEALKYVFGDLKISNSQRYNALVMLSNQEETKRSYLELLRKAGTVLEKTDTQYSGGEHCDRLMVSFKENYKAFGTPFVVELLDLAPEIDFGKFDFRICVSWFLGGSNINVTAPEIGTVISLMGCDRLVKRSLLPDGSNPHKTMTCLSDIREVSLLKRILKRPVTLNDLVVENCQMHRHELFERLAKLSQTELAAVTSNGMDLLFSSSPDLIEEALERIRTFLLD